MVFVGSLPNLFVGHFHYTIGQRARMGGMTEKWYVVKKQSDRNIVFLSQGDQHESLYASSLIAGSTNWLSGTNPLASTTNAPSSSLPSSPLCPEWREMRARCKLRHTPELTDCILRSKFVTSPKIGSTEDEVVSVEFLQPQRAIAPGQAIVFYAEREDVCYGAAIIQR